MEPVWIADAKYVGNYIMWLKFNDGKAGIVDLRPYAEEVEIFAPLKADEVIRNFSLDGWTITWLDSQLDIAPETLYSKLQPIA